MVERNAEYELARTQRLGDRNAPNGGSSEILTSDLPRRIEGYDISHIQGSGSRISGGVHRR